MKKKILIKYQKLHLKVGDKVIVLSGSHKNGTGKILRIDRKTRRAIVENLNQITKHVKRSQNKPGQIMTQEAPIHISNLMVLTPDGTPTKIGRKRGEDGKLRRYAKKTGEFLP